MVLGSLRGQGCIGAHHHLSQGGPRRAGWACVGLQQAAQLGALEMLRRQPGERQPGGVRAFPRPARDCRRTANSTTWHLAASLELMACMCHPYYWQQST